MPQERFSERKWPQTTNKWCLPCQRCCRPCSNKQEMEPALKKSHLTTHFFHSQCICQRPIYQFFLLTSLPSFFEGVSTQFKKGTRNQKGSKNPHTPGVVVSLREPNPTHQKPKRQGKLKEKLHHFLNDKSYVPFIKHHSLCTQISHNTVSYYGSFGFVLFLMSTVYSRYLGFNVIEKNWPFLMYRHPCCHWPLLKCHCSGQLTCQQGSQKGMSLYSPFTQSSSQAPSTNQQITHTLRAPAKTEYLKLFEK